MLDVEENGSKYQALISIVNGARAPVSLSSDVGSRFFKWILTNLQHPLIMPVSRCEYMIEQGKAVTVRRYESKGSLRDQVYRVRLVHSFVLSIGRSLGRSLLHQQSTPRYTYDYKYKSGGRALGAKEIALYGRQVLEALSYLEHIGFPYPHLHSGNVILNDKKVCMYVHAHPCRGLRTAALIPCATRSVQAVGGREHVARSGAVLLSRVECQARGRVLRTLAVRVGSWRFEYVLRAHDATR